MDYTLDIDKIWDEPIVQKRIDRTNEESDDSEQRPSKRPRQTLFLADSDDEPDTSPNAKQKAPPAQDIDIDALFADVEDDIDEEMTFKPLPPTLNEEELRRQAEARYRKELPPLTPHQVFPSSSAQPNTTEKSGDTRRRTGKDDQAKDEKKERRRLVKLDENRLLSPDGFPQLIKMTKDFRIKGKGHEVLSQFPTLPNVHLRHARQQIYIDFSRYINTGPISFIRRPNLEILLNALKNSVTLDVCT